MIDVNQEKLLNIERKNWNKSIKISSHTNLYYSQVLARTKKTHTIHKRGPTLPNIIHKAQHSPIMSGALSCALSAPLLPLLLLLPLSLSQHYDTAPVYAHDVSFPILSPTVVPFSESNSSSSLLSTITGGYFDTPPKTNPLGHDVQEVRRGEEPSRRFAPHIKNVKKNYVKN